jgi:hypothetical protein
LDANIPWTPEAKGFDKQWIHDLREAMPKPSEKNDPDPFAAIFATNFAGHYGLRDERQIHPEWVTIIPKHSRVPVHPLVLLRIDETVKRYSEIPRNV